MYKLFKYNLENELMNGIKTKEYSYFFSDKVLCNNKLNVFSTIKIKNEVIDTGFVFEKGRVYGTLFHPECKIETYQIYNNFNVICNNYKF